MFIEIRIRIKIIQMKFTLSEFLPQNNESFVIRRGQRYHALNELHSHEELELIHITEGTGVLILGETVISIAGGELFLIGCNVPHMFRFQAQEFIDPVLRRGEKLVRLNLLLLHFDPLLLGENFINMPENSLLKSLLAKAKSGLSIEGKQKADILALMEILADMTSQKKLMGLLALLNKIAAGESRQLTKVKGTAHLNKADESRLSKIFLITINNFHRRITLAELAEAVYMTPNAFCNYFKQKTGHTYFDFLLEVRIKHACKLLRTTDFAVSDICYFSGFTNLSNFNRQFKHFTGRTPLAYRKQVPGV